MVFVRVQAVNMEKRAKKKKKRKLKKKWMYLSLESMLCFLWLFLFLFYTQCMYYLWSCFWGVHWFKRVCHKRCFKRIYYPVYGSLSTINHDNILAGHTRSVMFVLQCEKKKIKCVSLSAPLWTQLCIRCNLCYISFSFFLMIQTCLWLYEKKTLWGKFICLLKKQNCSQTQVSGVMFHVMTSREKCTCCSLKRWAAL